MFSAYMIELTSEGVVGAVKELNESALPEGERTILSTKCASRGTLYPAMVARQCSAKSSIVGRASPRGSAFPNCA